MKKIIIRNLMETMEKEEENVSFLIEYTSNYISDIISEKADSMVEIYTSELFKMAYDLWIEGYTERAVLEFGANSGDLPRLLMASDFLQKQERLYEILEDAKIYTILYNLEEQGIKEITELQLDNIENLDLYNIDRLDDLYIDFNEIR